MTDSNYEEGKMKVSLVPNPFIINNRPASQVPVGLICIATVLRNAGINVEIIDTNAIASDSTFNNVPEAIMAKDPDVVGFSTVCTFYPITLRMAQRCKELNPDVKIILGGPQATFSDRATLEAFPCVDVIVRGEAEGTIVQVIDALSGCRGFHEIPGVTFRGREGIVRNETAPLIKNLDDLPDPMYDLFPSMHRVECIFIEFGRGCPFGCSFCSTNEFWQRTFRVQSIDHVVRLIKKLTIDYGTERLFAFVHDVFNFSRDSVVQLCEALKREKIDIHWDCDCRIDHLDKELLHQMAEAGCTSVFLGIESGSERMQKMISKKLDLSRVLEIANCITALGMNYTASFIIGFPDEKLEDLEQTINLAMALRYSSGKRQKIQLHRLYALSGCKLFREHSAELRFDGNFYGFAYSSLCEEDFEMVRKYPEVFSAYHYFPTKYYGREFLLWIHYVISSLFYMPYTGFIFYKDKALRFPRCITEYLPLLDLFPNFQSHSGKLETLVQLCKFLDAILHLLGIEEHPVRDVMRYELAVQKVKDSKNGGTPMEVKKFDYDVEGFIRGIDINEFQKLLGIIRKDRITLLFTKDGDKAIVARLPDKLARLLSPQSESKECLDRLGIPFIQNLCLFLNMVRER